MARFALFTNGVKVETLDDLKENFNIKDMLENFRNGSLERWLAENRFSGEVEQVSQIKKDSSDQSVIFRLFTIFSLSDEQIERSNKQEELRLEVERALREKEIREELQNEAHSEAILTNEDFELFWDDTELGLPDITSSRVSDSITFSVMKNQFISVGDALYCSDGITGGCCENFYESNNGINYKGIQELKTILEESSNEFITKIQQKNGKLFLAVINNDDITSDDVDFYVREGCLLGQQDDFNEISNRDFIIESDSNRSVWTVMRTEDRSPAWGVSVTDSGYAVLNLRAGKGYHDRKKRYPLESTQDIEDLQYFKGGYIAVGHWFSLDKEDVYSIYYSPDQGTFDPVTPPEAEFHRAGAMELSVFDNIAFVTAYPKPRGWSISPLEKTDQEILPGTKTYYSLDGRSWCLAPIKAHKIIKTDFGFLAYSVDYGISNQSFAYVNNSDESFSNFEDRDFRGFSDYYIQHLYISVDGIEWREMPLPSGRLKFILPLDNKFLFLSDGFFNIFTGKYHKRPSCFYGEIKRRDGNDGFLKKSDIKFEVINVPQDLRCNAKLLVSNGQSVKSGEKLLSCRTGLFTKKYFTAPFDCKIQFIVADFLATNAFIISKPNVEV